jgi:hypothetical protein
MAKIGKKWQKMTDFPTFFWLFSYFLGRGTN